MNTLATIGYQSTTMQSFLDTLREARIELLVDVRAVASSRRPGFSKTALAANLESVGIDYLHLRSLGTPADGRAAARSGHHDEMRRIFLAHLEEPAAQDGLDTLADIVRSGKRACLLCFEADPSHCHRAIVADAIAARMPVEVLNLRPEIEE